MYVLVSLHDIVSIKLLRFYSINGTPAQCSGTCRSITLLLINAFNTYDKLTSNKLSSGIISHESSRSRMRVRRSTLP